MQTSSSPKYTIHILFMCAVIFHQRFPCEDWVPRTLVFGFKSYNVLDKRTQQLIICARKNLMKLISQRLILWMRTRKKCDERHLSHLITSNFGKTTWGCQCCHIDITFVSLDLQDVSWPLWASLFPSSARRRSSYVSTEIFDSNVELRWLCKLGELISLS